MASIAEITSLVKKAAKEAGFDLAGIAAVRDFPELDYFPQWIAKGHAGEMKYLEARDEAGRLKRASLKYAAPWARSVAVCAINYNTRQPYSTQVNDPERGWISRYAWSQNDYHESVMRRLRMVEARLRELAGSPAADAKSPASTWRSVASAPPREGERNRASAPVHKAGNGTQQNGALAAEDWCARDSEMQPAETEVQTRCYVDTGPLVERVYAKYAGVGWIGKNTCILNQKMGSWLFLGVILTSLELAPDLAAPDRCGTCTRCIEACPTNALVAPYQLDSNKCISYLTIEKRGDIPEAMRAGMGHHIFGCDICQEVCPWNHKAPATDAADFQPRPELVNPALDWLAEMSAEQFRASFRGSPVKRAKLSGIRRNAVISMGNSRNPRFRDILQKLISDADPAVADHAAWALGQLEKG